MISNTEEPKEIWERKKLGLELRQKYELYFVSLIFTLAGLSVQSASRSGPIWRLTIEVLGWVLLTSGGILGLWRISRLWITEITESRVQAASWTGGNPDLSRYLDNLEKRIRVCGTIQNVLFVLGFIAVLISRATSLLTICTPT
jgi:hypothetical protein